VNLADLIVQRLQHAEDVSPGALNLAADIVADCSLEANHWTTRADDALRIPDMLAETAQNLRQRAAAMI
jgi:hypothetical protein